MKSTIQNVKGMRDQYPENLAVRNWLYQSIREVSESFGYEEWEGPYVERIDLYAAKSGEELVKEQAFVFNDRGGDLITLRPELTPSLARMVAERQKQLVYPLRWWQFGPFWRYERPQRGRTREFFQWNIDLIGVDTPEADAELVAIAAGFFQKVGLKPEQVQILVNNRKLTGQELNRLGIPEERRMDVFHLIDRRDKMQPDAWDTFAGEIGLSAQQVSGLKTILDDADLWQRLPDFQRFFATIDAMGVREWVHYAPNVIRGLDYYTGMVFEAYDVGGGRAVFGGGHYGNLVADVGGEPMPGVGFAMGDVMIGLVLEKYGLVPGELGLEDTVLVTVFDESLLLDSFQLSAELRSSGVKAVCFPEAAKLQKQLKFADRKHIRYAVIVGPDEAAAGQVTVKDLSGRTQETLARAEVPERLRLLLAN